MELKLGRPLTADEDVHHIDLNPLNNDINNLLVINHRTHCKKHGLKNSKWLNAENKLLICPICGKLFIFTVKQQRYNYGERNRRKTNEGPFCSKHCCGIHNQREQIRQKTLTECQ